MELRINLDLEAALASALTPEKLGPILDKHISEAITTAVRDATGYRSAFSEALKEQLAASLPHGLGVDDIAKFQHVLNTSLNSAVHGMNAATINAALAKVAGEVLPDVPASIKLSEFIEAARDGFHKEKHEAFFAFFEPSEYGNGGRLYLDSDADKSERNKYSADLHIAFNKEGEVYSLRLDGKDVTPASRPNLIGCFDGLVMCMYVGRTKLEVDIDAYDVEGLAGSQED